MQYVEPSLPAKMPQHAIREGGQGEWKSLEIEMQKTESRSRQVKCSFGQAAK